MSDYTILAIIATIGCVAAWAERLGFWVWVIPKLNERHRRCEKRHPGRTHEEWLRGVYLPAAAAFYTKHGKPQWVPPHEPSSVPRKVRCCQEHYPA